MDGEWRNREARFRGPRRNAFRNPDGWRNRELDARWEKLRFTGQQLRVFSEDAPIGASLVVNGSELFRSWMGEIVVEEFAAMRLNRRRLFRRIEES